nr:serine/threonine-protein kinase [Ktedonobacteraceae bacterium]
MPKNTRTPSPPSGQLGAYELRYLLGSGGFGDVYLGEHIHLHSLAAIKVLHDDLLDEQVEQFRREALLVAQLAPHPHIVRVLDYNIENGHPFIVMDYAINGDLRKRHGVGKKVPLVTVVSYVKQLARGLQHAHNNGVVHCDVKPENMFVGNQGRILIGDFGIAKVLQGNFSQSKNTLGTTAYMSPEHIHGHPEPASDQYALAIAAYEWLTGRLPFTGNSKFAIMHKHLHAQPPSMRLRHPSIPAAVEKVVMKALSKDPQQRYASITAFAEALEEAAASTPGQASTTRQAPRPVKKSGSQPQRPQRRQRGLFRLNSLFLPSLLFIVLTGVSLWAYVVLPTATVSITTRDVPQPWQQSLSAVIDSSDPTKNPVTARTETVTTTPQHKTVATTGKQYIKATQAQGEVTFYNWDLIAHEIPSGTTIAVTVPNRSSQTVTEQVVTDEAITVPAGDLSQAGQIAGHAHILQPGTPGNIAANALYGETCCGSNAIRVNNQQPFTGGQDAQTYRTVQQSDVEGAFKPLATAQAQGAPALLRQHTQPQEILVLSSIHCSPIVNKNAALGSRAKYVTVTVMSICTSTMYDSAKLATLVKAQLRQRARPKPGNTYGMVDEPRINVTNAYVLKAKDSSNILHLDVAATGLWRYNFSAIQQQRILQAIAGQKVTTAREQLKNTLSKEGVVLVDVAITWNFPSFIEDSLPTDVQRIKLQIMHQ